MTSVWSTVIGQQAAIEQLQRAVVNPVHAYLFVGPPGSTKHEAARAFAGLLLGGVDDPEQRDVRLAMAGAHPDAREFARIGASINSEQADEIIRLAALAPNESSRKVLILDEFHLLSPEAAAKLLKTIEEPPASTVFIVLADQLPHDLVTIASRCVRINFRALSDAEIVDVLVADAIDVERATASAVAARGDLNRARLLATDPALEQRRAMFATVPTRLDGNGRTAALLVEQLLAAIDAAAASLTARHQLEAEAMSERIAALGERGSGRKALEDKHKRELRRHRTDEIRSGLATLAASYRDALVVGSVHRPDDAVQAVRRIHTSIEAMERNPNESLLLQALLLELPPLVR